MCNELNIDAFDLSTGFMCSDVHKLEKLGSLSIKYLK